MSSTSKHMGRTARATDGAAVTRNASSKPGDTAATHHAPSGGHVT